MLADLLNKSDKKQNALNTELSEFNTELKVISSSVYKADSEPIRDHWYYTFHSDDCPIFLKKKKNNQLNWDTLFNQLALGHLVQRHFYILHLLGGCPILKGSKHGSLQPSSWHQTTVQTGMQMPKPENKRRLTAHSTELGKNCQDQ